MWGSAKLLNSATTAWLDSWWPKEAFGGRAGLECLDASVPIAELASEGSYVGAFEYSLAFDYNDPT